MTNFVTNPIKSQSFAYNWNEIKMLIEKARVTNQRDYTLFITFALSGRRSSEIVGRNDRPIKMPGLKPQDIDFETKTINWTIAKRYVDPKTRTIRYTTILPAHSKMMEVLSKYITLKNINPNEKIFDITIQRVNQIMHKYCKECGIINKARLVHAFRHGFAIESLKQCDTPEEMINVQRNLQHTSFAMTENYLAFTKNKQREVLEKMEL